jgi:hypothetical protein
MRDRARCLALRSLARTGAHRWIYLCYCASTRQHPESSAPGAIDFAGGGKARCRRQGRDTMPFDSDSENIVATQTPSNKWAELRAKMRAMGDQMLADAVRQADEYASTAMAECQEELRRASLRMMARPLPNLARRWRRRVARARQVPTTPRKVLRRPARSRARRPRTVRRVRPQSRSADPPGPDDGPPHDRGSL